MAGCNSIVTSEKRCFHISQQSSVAVHGILKGLPLSPVLLGIGVVDPEAEGVIQVAAIV